MSRTVRTSLGIAIALLVITGAVHADWQCTTDVNNSAAACYVSNVRYYPGTPSYVQAKLHDPEAKSDCVHIRVKVNDSAESIGNVRGSKTVLLTALVTGLPIKFYVVLEDEFGVGSNGTCDVTSIIIAKHGN